MNQYTDWTIHDINIEECKKSFFPNWVNEYNSRSEAIQGILDMMQGREGLFAGLGFAAGQITKRKKKEK